LRGKRPLWQSHMRSIRCGSRFIGETVEQQPAIRCSRFSCLYADLRFTDTECEAAGYAHSSLLVALVGLFLVGCGSGAAPSGTGATAAARPPAIAARMTLFHCDSYPKPEHYTEKCVLTFKVDSANAGHWLRRGCFGELKLTQASISDRPVQSSSHGFLREQSKTTPASSRQSLTLRRLSTSPRAMRPSTRHSTGISAKCLSRFIQLGPPQGTE